MNVRFYASHVGKGPGDFKAYNMFLLIDRQKSLRRHSALLKPFDVDECDGIDGSDSKVGTFY